MLKRKNETEDFVELNSKVRKYSSPEDEAKNQQPHLPMELLREIAFYVSDINDLRSWLSLSKDIRNMVFGIPEVMRKIRVNFTSDIKFEEFLKFLHKRGHYIRNLKFEPDFRAGKCLQSILNLVPNLEEFSFKSLDPETEEVGFEVMRVESTLSLKSLECLDLSDPVDIEDFVENVQNVKSLRKLSIDVPEIENREILTNLICQQNNLSELYLTIFSIDAPIFPSRDVSHEVNFKLKKLKLSLPNIDQEMFVNFLKTQAQSLEELELNCIVNIPVFESIFNHFKNLKKFTIDEDASDVIFGNEFPEGLKLENLKYFHDKNQNGTVVSKLFRIFRNIETLKCCDTMHATGTYEKLTTLEVSEVYWPRIRNLKMPNLKNLFIKKIDKCDDPYYWTHFTANFLNIENITVEKLGYEGKDVLRFVKRLKVFEKLKSFKLRHGNAIEHDYVLDENERVKNGEKFFKILIDTSKKTIKVSSYIAQKCPKIVNVLRRTFKSFEFFEFCFDEMKISKIINENLCS